MNTTSMSKTLKVDNMDEAIKLIQEQHASDNGGLRMSNASIYSRYDTKAKDYVGYTVSLHFIAPLASADELEELSD